MPRITGSALSRAVANHNSSLQESDALDGLIQLGHCLIEVRAVAGMFSSVMS
jgi:hypothetical protein